MQDVFYVEDLEQAMALLKPIRIDLLKRMDEPRTCPELAQMFDETPQGIYYHVKALEKAGLVQKTEERRVRGVVEGYYQATARAYWLAPQLVNRIGGQRMSQDQVSLRVLLELVENVQDDIGHLANQAEAGRDVPSLSLSGQIELPEGERRAAFLQEVQSTFEKLARKYGMTEDTAEGDTFRLVLMVYPNKVVKPN